MHVDIYTDGSARGNPNGPGGYGAITEYVDSKGQLHTKEYSQGYQLTTNNRMELMAAIAALKDLNRPCDVTLYSDSKYLVDAFNQHWIDGWRKKNFKDGQSMRLNYDLWLRLDELNRTHKIEFVWVKGHAGHPQNERCDKLATEAADGDNLEIDKGYITREE